MDSFLDVLIPPLLGFMGVHSIYKAWKYGKNIKEVESAHIIPDGQSVAKACEAEALESGAYVAISGRLFSRENSTDVIATRRKVENIDKLFSTTESISPVRVGQCRLERSLGRSLSSLGRTQKERLALETPHKACGFESLFTETKVIDMAQRHTLLNTQILRVTEEAVLAGMSVTVLAQLDLTSSELVLSMPLAWHRLFIISSNGVKGVLEDLREELSAHRRSALIALSMLVMYFAVRSFFDPGRGQSSSSLGSRRHNMSRSYDSVELNTDSPCVVCLEVQPEVLLVDCGHAVLCHRCAEQMSTCPLCRADILQPPCRIFLS